MKTMTCNQLGGACDQQFHANTFKELAGISKKHAVEMAAQGDRPHLEAMQKMKVLMTDPQAMKSWFQKVQAEFISLPEDK